MVSFEELINLAPVTPLKRSVPDAGAVEGDVLGPLDARALAVRLATVGSGAAGGMNGSAPPARQ